MFLAMLRGMWDLSSLTRDGTCILCFGSTESQPLDHQGSPSLLLLMFIFHVLRHPWFSLLNTTCCFIFSPEQSLPLPLSPAPFYLKRVHFCLAIFSLLLLINCFFWRRSNIPVQKYTNSKCIT